MLIEQQEVFKKMLSGSKILLTITLELKMILENI